MNYYVNKYACENIFSVPHDLFFIFIFDDIGILEVFDPTRLISSMAPTKSTQKHTGKIRVGFEHNMPLHQLPRR